MHVGKLSLDSMLLRIGAEDSKGVQVPDAVKSLQLRLSERQSRLQHIARMPSA